MANATCCYTWCRGTSILDTLNPDCWRDILDYVPVEQVIRSERVSRVWRERILEYLQGIQLSVEYNHPSIIRMFNWDPHPNSRQLTLNKDEPPEQQGVLFSKLVSKFGPRIVFIGTDRITEADLGNIIWNCPNLESILIPDEYVSNLLEQVPLQDLIINNASYVSGMFMTDPNLKLKHLSITSCHNMMTEFFPNAEDLCGLTTLELVLNSPQVYRNVHQLLRNTPNLENLSLVTFDKKINVGPDFVQALADLKKLKRFYARFINNERDGWLEDVAAGCMSLTALDIANCRGVTPRSLVTFCKARGPALLELGLAWNTALTDDDLSVCLALCTNLKTLDIQGCVLISPRLIQIVRENPRIHPLCIRLRRTRVPNDMKAECRWLILDFRY